LLQATFPLTATTKPSSGDESLPAAGRHEGVIVGFSEKQLPTKNPLRAFFAATWIGL
jgi:hypothetical protein